MDQVFVAMSFESRFNERYENIIKPSIENEMILGVNLKAYRVDNSKTGDSILSEIIDGIAHSRLVLADVSVIDEGRYTETPIRNGNVMYEVGLALACRNPSEVLLIRDDSKKFLFDVSTIPHMTLDCTDDAAAIESLRNAIADRISESRLSEDARIRIAAQTLTEHEVGLLKFLSNLDANKIATLDVNNSGILSFPVQHGLDGLIRKGCVKSFGINPETGAIFYALNKFGRALAEVAKTELPEYQTVTEKEPNGPVED